MNACDVFDTLTLVIIKKNFWDYEKKNETLKIVVQSTHSILHYTLYKPLIYYL